jgi:hypothetical protein
MASSLLAQSQSSKVISPFQVNGSNASLVYATGQVLGVLARILWLGLLFLLLITAVVVWIWLYSFRSGWQFWEWLIDLDNASSAASTLIYGLIVLLVSPFILFAEWSQAMIQKWLNVPFPPQVNLRQIVERQLGTKLGDNFPFLRDNSSEQD